MKILVTGGLGFIGHNVVSKLETLGHEVIIIDNQSTYDLMHRHEVDHLVQERREKIKTPNIFYLPITDNLDRIFEVHKPEMVIHLASHPRQKAVLRNPEQATNTMITGLVNVCETSLKHDVKKIIFISSSMVYGDFSDPIKETAICKPIGLYGVLKLAGENVINEYGRKGLTYTIIRPSAVYGPNDAPDRVITKFFLSAMAGKTLYVDGQYEELDFTYVDDVAEGIVQASLSPYTHFQTYNLTNNNARSLLEAAALVTRIVGKGNVEIRARQVDFPSRGALNIDAARRDFNYNPQTQIEEGFNRYFQYLNNSLFWNSKAV